MCPPPPSHPSRPGVRLVCCALRPHPAALRPAQARHQRRIQGGECVCIYSPIPPPPSHTSSSLPPTIHRRCLIAAAAAAAQVMGTLRGHDDKVRVVLNKADQVDQQQLMRVYGALMWSLGKVFRSPEVCRVYIGRWGGCGGWGVGRAGSGRCGEEPGVGEHRRRGPKRRAPL